MTTQQPPETIASALRKGRAKRQRPWSYGRLAVLVDPNTGEPHRCMVFLASSDISHLRERGFKAGDIVRGQISKAVDPYVNRLLHAMGRLFCENIEAFAHLKAHACLKQLQAESGIFCEPMSCQIVGSDEVAVVNVPNSLAFDSADDSEYREFSRAISRYVTEKYWPDMDPDGIEELTKIQAKAESV